MTLLAGAIARRGQVLSKDVAANLSRVISRYPGDAPLVFQQDACCIIKVDIGAYPEPGWYQSPAGSLSALAGEPIVSVPLSETATSSRFDDLRLLSAELDRGDIGRLREARGAFSLAHFAHADSTITLATDKLGIRPVYVAEGANYYAFASAIRVLEQLPDLELTPDLRGITELVAMGYPLGDRTPYANVRLMRPGEILQLAADGISCQRYWRWDEIPESRESIDVLADEAHRRFVGAVRSRLRGSPLVPAFLSGGLDSRCVVATLVELGAKVHTFNFSPPESQDRRYGSLYATIVGTTHHAYERGAAPDASRLIPPTWAEVLSSEWSRSIAAAWAEVAAPLGAKPARSLLVWSGDGGSVGVGLVHVEPDVVELLRRGDLRGAVPRLLRQEGAVVPRRVLRRALARELEPALASAVQEELEAVTTDDPARALHLMLMLNDQHRDSANHFEHIDRHRLELQLPFFDSRFLETILSVPIDAAMHHAFYSKWLARFPRTTTQVPWQTYPGHVPCPIGDANAGTSQWQTDDEAPRASWRTRRAALASALRLALSPTFPSSVLRRSSVLAAGLLRGFGLRDTSYALRGAAVYARYAAPRRSDGAQ